MNIFDPGTHFFAKKYFSGPGFSRAENLGLGPRGVPDPPSNPSHAFYNAKPFAYFCPKGADRLCGRIPGNIFLRPGPSGPSAPPAKPISTFWAKVREGLGIVKRMRRI